MKDEEEPGSPVPPVKGDPDRRGFLSSATVLVMAGGLAASYGTFATMAGSFLYPAGGRPRAWVFVTQLARMKVGDSLDFRAPTGERIAIARQGATGKLDDFVALSSTCPHLGCQVHWEGQNDRFFCPCHNGIFDRQGKGVGGPPGDAGQVLPRYPLRIENDLLFIEVPTTGLRTASLEDDEHAVCRHGHPDGDHGKTA